MNWPLLSAIDVDILPVGRENGVGHRLGGRPIVGEEHVDGLELGARGVEGVRVGDVILTRREEATQ